MNRVVADKFETVRALAAKHGVRRLYLFGSAVSDAFDAARSDLDFLVEFKPSPPGGRANSYFGLLEDFESLFGRQVDLIEAGAIRNPYFLAAVEETKLPLYEAP